MTNNDKNFDIKNVAIWVGSGISIDAPARLPSGYALTKFALDKMILGKDKFLEIWSQINKYEEDFCHTSISKYPRLELVLSSIAYIENYFIDGKNLRGSFLRGLTSFDKVPFNENHMLLAVLRHAGARIVTANFDLGIERAYQALYQEECKGVIHFHGTNASKKKIGATLENITHLVNSDMAKRIKNCFKSGKSNYFFGYSFSDRYDINATLFELYSNPEAKYTKNNRICNHKNLDTELAMKAEKAFFSDINFQINTGETTEELRRLCEEYSIDIPDLNFKMSEWCSDNKCWEDLFLEDIEITEEFQVLSSIHFYNRMGIAVDLINPEILEKYMSIEYQCDKKEIIEYHLAVNSRDWFEKNRVSRLQTEYHKNALAQRFASANMEQKHDDIQIKTVERLIQDINKVKFISQEDWRQLTARMHRVKYPAVSKRKNQEIEESVSLIKTFLALPVGKFISITAYACIYRYKAFLDSICEKEDESESAFQMANELYYDIGNIDGIISTRLDYFLSREYKKDSLDWEKTIKGELWQTLKKLCVVTGSHRYEKKMNKMEELFLGSNLNQSPNTSLTNR